MSQDCYNVDYPQISQKTIELDVTAKTWEDSVISAGLLLCKEGYVEINYIQSMINTVKELGSYVIIYPGFALPHASPDNGVKHTGLSFIKLKSPVIFPDKENDPVKNIIAFCANHTNRHVQLLKCIALLFRKDEIVKTLVNSNDKEEIFEIFKANLSI